MNFADIFRSSESSRSSSTQQPLYFPGQKGLAGRMKRGMEDVYWGGTTSPVAKMLQELASREIQSQLAQGRAGLAETPGMTQPARQAAAAGLEKAGVQGVAGIPGQVWGEAAKFLGQYALQPPTTLTTSMHRGVGTGSMAAGISELLSGIMSGLKQVGSAKP